MTVRTAEFNTSAAGAAGKALLYVGNFLLPDGNAASLRVLANAKLFRQLGYTVTILGTHEGASQEQLRHRTIDGFECLTVSSPKGTKAWMQYTLGHPAVLRVVRDRAPQTAAVICYNYPSVAQARIFRTARSSGAKAVTDVTEWYDATGGSLGFNFVKGLDTWLRMRVVNSSADAFLTTSAVITRLYSGSRRPTLELPTLFDTERYAPPPARLPGAEPRFIYAGSPFVIGRVNSRRTNVKDRLDLCLDAFIALHELGIPFQFDIYGITQPEYLDVYPEYATDLAKLESSIHFHGKASHATVLKATASADCSLFLRDPNRVVLAGFPTKLAESISAGTPAITNRHANVVSYSEAPGVLLCEAADASVAVTAIAKLSPAERDALKKLCFESRTFDYRSFTAVADVFLRALSPT